MKIIDCTSLIGGGKANGPMDIVKVMPETAIVRRGMPFFRPDWAESWRLTLKTGVIIDRLGKNVAPQFVRRYWNSAVLVIQAEPTENAGPETINIVGFDGSLLLSSPLIPPIGELSLRVNSLPRAVGEPQALINEDFKVDFSESVAAGKISYVSRFFTLHTGDIILIDTVPGISIEAVADTRLQIERLGYVIVNHKIK